MTNGKNLNVKEKMASLDTLSSGIVFGKEAAWDKLQARMDAKPVKRIPLKFWLVAAAMLLLCVTIVTIYNAPEKLVAKNDDNKEIKGNENKIVVALPGPQVIAQPALVTKQQNVTMATGKKQTAKLPVFHVQEIQPEVTHVEILTAPEVKQVTEELSIAKTPEPSLPVKKLMKVVHVNDLVTEPAQAAPAIVTNIVPESSPKKIRVVHLNDINAQQQTLDNYLRQTKANFAVTIPFFNSGSVSSTPSNNSENHTLHHSLKFKIN